MAQRSGLRVAGPSRSVVTELPKIAERQIGPLESGLGKDMDAIYQSVGQGFDAFINGRTATMADSAQKLHNSVHGLFDKLRHPASERCQR